ncbi:cysteine proteinase [Zopfia rhizophila CBS 207.26]|uniref:Ubiquitin carboxyl-terminal hydrolase n=1 Tax=Zopfia rhizophila CBS 207.26 TaxID=1314779 RepID=A0A6A6EQP3_9PEZI|nr:cysteine proteinase [Zopfia rhizophila CBS 207.26]
MAPKKTFTILENNPAVVTHLAHKLGLSPHLAFHDIYSFTDPDLLAFIPRPALAILVIIPMTPTWYEARQAEDENKGEYEGFGEEEPVIWFKQTIADACGSIGLIHCLLNGAAKDVTPGSTLDQIRQAALPKKMMERAKVLEDSDALEQAHQEAAKMGDSEVPSLEEQKKSSGHFVAFIKGKDGHLYELEGSRKGPLDRGELREDEDVLSERAVERGLGRLMRIEAEKGGNLRFSAIALAESLE